SATITPDGTVTAQTEQFTPDVLVDHTTLRTTTTLASALGAGPEWALVALGLVAVGVAVATRRGTSSAAGRNEDG
ncbi:MAG: apolipoprotein N-acyltransferase, partial [Pseudonocardia sp.]|nr:apolipoprotein N-acyltransferase [Pseudonocardia sp.]